MLLTRLPLNREPKPSVAFDLHVLGTPPALILSQDQTLMLIRCLCRGGLEGPPLPEQLLTRAPVDLALALFRLSLLCPPPPSHLAALSFGKTLTLDGSYLIRVLARTI